MTEESCLELVPNYPARRDDKQHTELDLAERLQEKIFEGGVDNEQKSDILKIRN